jgi:hypothetical protein
MAKKPIEIIHSFDNGRKIVTVPLSNSKERVKLWEVNYSELIKLGASPPWKYVQECIWVRNNGRDISVARLLLDCGPGQRVSFLNGDAGDLTRPNLLRIAGPAKYHARDQLDPAKQTNKPEIKHTQFRVREGLNIR